MTSNSPRSNATELAAARRCDDAPQTNARSLCSDSLLGRPFAAPSLKAGFRLAPMHEGLLAKTSCPPAERLSLARGKENTPPNLAAHKTRTAIKIRAHLADKNKYSKSPLATLPCTHASVTATFTLNTFNSLVVGSKPITRKTRGARKDIYKLQSKAALDRTVRIQGLTIKVKTNN